MDHLPFPQETEPPIVPFIGTEYDDGKFSSYPERQGVQDDLRTLSFERLSPEEYQAFFQTWLYFGSLARVFKIAGVQVDRTKFVQKNLKGDLIVTSACLNQYIDEWKQQEEKQSYRSSKKRRGAVLYHIRVVLRAMQSALLGPAAYFWNYVKEKHTDSPVMTSWRNIVLSVAALGYTFQRVSDLLYAPVNDRDYNHANWILGVSWVLRERMEQSGWCRALIAKSLAADHFDFILFVGGIEFPRKVENHDECTATVCRGRIVDTGNYKTKHLLETCKCKMQVIPVLNHDIIEKDGIPIAYWSEKEGLRVTKYKNDEPYVAISHIWSDGKGNPYTNALPRCQLESIQNKINNLYAVPRRESRPAGLDFGPWKRHAPRDPHRKPIGFWMDTLCVPVGDEEKPKNLRRKAITQMRAIYETADRVLVLDDRIEQLSLSSSICDRAVHLVVSNWQSRIWTLQEGIMAQQIFFQFANGPLTLDELDDEEALSREKAASSPGFWHGVSYQLQTLLSIALIAKEGEPRPSVNTLFEEIVPVAMRRMTTKFEDETICLATLLRLNLMQILGIRSKHSSEELKIMPKEEKIADELLVCEGRMKMLLCMIGRFNKGIIFNDLPRLSTDGFRWAPRSFLGQSGTTVPHDNPERVLEAWEEPASIFYRDGSFKARSYDDSVESINPESVLGLLVAYPGVMLHSMSVSLIQSGRFYVREKTHKRYQYRVSLNLTHSITNSKIDKQDVKENRYALVTAASISSEYDDSPITALFGAFTGMMESGTRKFYPMFLAKVEIVNWRGSKSEGVSVGSEEGEGWHDDDESVKSVEIKMDAHETHQEDEEKESPSNNDHDTEDDSNSDQYVDSDWVDDEDGSDELVPDENDDGSEDEDGEGSESSESDSSEDDDSSYYGSEDSKDLHDGKMNKVGFDFDGEDDSSSDEDERIKREQNEAPKPNEVVYGKLLLSRNNRWCIM